MRSDPTKPRPEDDPLELDRRRRESLNREQTARDAIRATREKRERLDDIQQDEETRRELRNAVFRKQAAEDEARAQAKRKKKPRRPAPSRRRARKGAAGIVSDILFGHGLLLIVMAFARALRAATTSGLSAIGALFAGRSAASGSVDDLPSAEKAVAGVTVAATVTRNGTRPGVSPPKMTAESAAFLAMMNEADRRPIEEVRAELARKDRERKLPGLQALARAASKELYGNPKFYAALAGRVLGNLDRDNDAPGAYHIVASWDQPFADALFSDELNAEDEGFQKLRAKLLTMVERHGDPELAMSHVAVETVTELSAFMNRSFPNAGPEMTADGGEVGAKTVERKQQPKFSGSPPADDEPDYEPAGPKFR